MKVSPGCSSARNTAWFICRAGVRLHVGEIAAEQLLGALDRQRLGDVDELAAAVIAPARITFGIFVGQHRALRLQHRARDDIFRGDQLDLVTLATEFQLDHVGDFGVALLQGRGEKEARRRGRAGDRHGQSCEMPARAGRACSPTMMRDSISALTRKGLTLGDTAHPISGDRWLLAASPLTPCCGGSVPQDRPV